MNTETACSCAGLALEVRQIETDTDGMSWAVVERNTTAVSMFEEVAWTSEGSSYDLHMQIILWLDNSLEWGTWCYNNDQQILFMHHSHAMLFKLAWENRCDNMAPF
jgi:hypothetical protein